MLRSLRVCFATFLIMFVACNSYAQMASHPPPALMKQYKTAVDNTMAVVRSTIRPLLTPEQKKLLDGLVISVEPDSWDIYGIRADLDNEPPTIWFPLGLVYVQDHIDSAAVMTEMGDVPFHRLIAYIHAVTDTVREHSERAGNENLVISDLPDFRVFAGLSTSKLKRIESSDDYRLRKEAIKLSSFAFIFMHEFWHHMNPGASLKEREVNADIFAAELGAQTEYNAMLALYTFMFFASIEGDQSLYEIKPGYPAPLCRGLYFFDQGWTQANKDPDFVKYIKDQGLWKEWQEHPSAIREVLVTENVTCPNLPPSSAIRSAVTRPGVKPSSVPGYPVRIRSWSPTPGQCNGVELDLFVDDKHVATIANMLDSSPQDIGKLEGGIHSFSFDDITGFSIEPSPPYRARKYFSDASCNGTFEVRSAQDLHINLTTTPTGKIMHCRLVQ